MSGSAGSLYRVVVVDDSAVVRGIVTRWLEADPEIKVVATFPNGAQAVRQIADLHADVVVLDIEMPEMDGITALPLLLKAVPDLKIIMSSTLTRRNAEISFKALSLGAADTIAKPETGSVNTDTFRAELLQKVKSLAISRPAFAKATAGKPATTSSAGAALAAVAPAKAAKLQIALRNPSRTRPAILAIGSSTGGPQALLKLLSAIAPDLSVPTVITQHMPATFTAILAEHIQGATKRPSKEAASGDVLQPGHIYVAPGDYHLTVIAEGASRMIKVNQDPPENFCRPAVDPMFRSIARAYGASALAVVLTGMGSDGREGGRVLVDAGGTMIAQDEASSVVWGMPGAVATAGLASMVLPLDQIGPAVSRLIKGGA